MKRKLAFVLVSVLIISSLCALSVGAVPTTSPPSDLTGYTVSVPSGWSAESGYGLFDVSGIVSYTSSFGVYYENYQFSTLNIGYFRTSPAADIISFADIGYESSTSSDYSLTLTITGGDASNSSLIQWLVDNDASFDNGEEPIPSFPIAGGFYAYDISPLEMPSVDTSMEGQVLVYPLPSGSLLYLNEAYNVERGTEIPIQALVIQFANIVDSNNYHIKVGVWYSDDLGFIPENVFTIVCTHGSFTKVNRFSFSRFYLSNSAEFDEWGFNFFNAVFVPSDQPVPIFEGSPIAYIISSINDALRVDIFGTYSIMDIVTIFVSLSLLIWVLKMLAGG